MGENKIYIGTWPKYVGVSSIEARKILEDARRQLCDWRKNEYIPDMLNKKLNLKEKETNETD